MSKIPSFTPCSRACSIRSRGSRDRGVAEVKDLPSTGSIWLKVTSNLRASACARVRAVSPHRLMKPSALSAARRPGLSSAAVSSLKRKYADVKRSSSIAMPVNRPMDLRSTSSGGIRSTSPSPSKKAPVIRPRTSCIRAMVPSSSVM